MDVELYVYDLSRVRRTELFSRDKRNANENLLGATVGSCQAGKQLCGRL